jgi:hypothetical protein
MRMRILIRGPGIFLTLDSGSGMEKIRIRDKHPESAPLLYIAHRSFQYNTDYVRCSHGHDADRDRTSIDFFVWIKLIVLQSLVLSNSDCQLEEISLVQRLRENIMASLYDCVCVVR